MPLFCKEFNAKTSGWENGKIVNVKIVVYEDKTFNFYVKSTPTSILLKSFLKKKEEGDEKVISSEDFDKIINEKIKDLNTNNLEKMKKIILGSAKSAGIKIENY